MEVAGEEKASKRTGDEADDKQNCAQRGLATPRGQPADGSQEVLVSVLSGFLDGFGGLFARTSEQSAVDECSGHDWVADLHLLPGQGKDVHEQRLNLARARDTSATARARCCASYRRRFYPFLREKPRPSGRGCRARTPKVSSCAVNNSPR